MIIWCNPVCISFCKAAPLWAPGSRGINSWCFLSCGDFVFSFQVAVPSASCKRVYAFPVTRRTVKWKYASLMRPPQLVAVYCFLGFFCCFLILFTRYLDKHQVQQICLHIPLSVHVVSFLVCRCTDFICMVQFFLCWAQAFITVQCRITILGQSDLFTCWGTAKDNSSTCRVCAHRRIHCSLFSQHLVRLFCRIFHPELYVWQLQKTWVTATCLRVQPSSLYNYESWIVPPKIHVFFNLICPCRCWTRLSKVEKTEGSAATFHIHIQHHVFK